MLKVASVVIVLLPPGHLKDRAGTRAAAFLRDAVEIAVGVLDQAAIGRFPLLLLNAARAETFVAKAGSLALSPL